MIKKLNVKSDFFRSVLVLMTGTVLAQAVGYLVSPILTRMYTTEEMGDLGIYMRLVGFISALATARFELSLPIPKHEGHSFLLYRLSLKIAQIVVISLLVLLVLYYFIKPLGLNDFLFALITIVSTFFVVIINLGTNWSIRTSEFKKISQQRIVNSMISNNLKWVFGLFSFGSMGLILSSLIGYVISSVSFVRQFIGLKNGKYKNYSKKKPRVLALEYREFPLVNLPHVLLDLGRDLAIAGLIVYFFDKDIFGSYSHSYAMLRLPMVIIGASIGQVFFNKCSELVNKGQSTYPLMRRTMLILFGLSIVPFSIIFFFGEPMFSFVFSERWAESGYYSEIMAVWLMVNFMVSPLSSLPLVLGRQKEFFFIGLISTLIQLAGFGLVPLMYGSSKETFVTVLWMVSIIMAVFLVFVAIISLYYAKMGLKVKK